MDLEINNNHNKKNSSDIFSQELKNHIEKTKINFSIDRFEENFAVCENMQTGEIINIPKELLPNNCKEGSILKFENGNYILDIEKTNLEQEKIKKIVNGLFKKKNK